MMTNPKSQTKRKPLDLETEIIDQFLCGDSTEVLAQLPDACVDTVVTSPPYFQQRDYGSELQIGQERAPDEYAKRLAELFIELRRVVKPTGSAWVVIGDKYVKGELLGMPWRVCLAIKDTGWILRSDCIWHKPNAMPSSAKTRPTVDHEYIFFFSHSKDYHYDADAIREPHVTFSEKSKMKGGRKHFGKRGGTPEKGKNSGDSNLHDGRWDQAFHPKGRNKRTVWSISLSKFREAHFAVFPEQLVTTCIQATCPIDGVVMDPFSGAGTTALTAKKLGRRFVGIDCNQEYCQMGARRLKDWQDKIEATPDAKAQVPRTSAAKLAGKTKAKLKSVKPESLKPESLKPESVKPESAKGQSAKSKRQSVSSKRPNKRQRTIKSE